MLQVGAALFNYELGQMLLQIRVAITNYGKSYYKIEQLLQTRAKCITNCSGYYKLGQLLQIVA